MAEFYLDTLNIYKKKNRKRESNHVSQSFLLLPGLLFYSICICTGVFWESIVVTSKNSAITLSIGPSSPYVQSINIAPQRIGYPFCEQGHPIACAMK